MSVKICIVDLYHQEYFSVIQWACLAVDVLL